MVGFYSRTSVTVAVVLSALSVNALPSQNTELARRLISGLDGFGVTPACESTLTGLLSSPASTCLNLPGTVAILSTVANSSWISPTNAWLTDMCSQDDCTSEEISATLNTVADGCQEVLDFLQLTREYVIEQAVNYFSVAKQALCLRDESNDNDLCAITTLENLETALGGPLTPELVMDNYDLLLENDAELARELACTPCASAAFALVRPALPQEILSLIDSFVGDQCGVDFTSEPSGSIHVVTGSQALLAAEATASTSSSTSIYTPVGGLVGVVLTSAVGILAGLVALF